jgi:hypothetical protein
MNLLFSLLLLTLLLATDGACAFTVPSSSSTTKGSNKTSFGLPTSALSSTNQDLERRVQELTDLVLENNKRFDENDKRFIENDKRFDESKRESDERFDGIVSAFGPATKYELMETAVYTFVEGLLQYPASSTANCVLSLLLSEKKNPRLPFAWRGTKMDAATKLVVGKQVLGALVTFIEDEHMTEALLKDWPPERNLVAHNGVFLDSLYDPGVRGRGEPGFTAAQVKAMRANFVEKRKAFKADIDVEAGLEKVVAALEGKGLAANARGKRAVRKLLNRCFGD